MEAEGGISLEFEVWGLEWGVDGRWPQTPNSKSQTPNLSYKPSIAHMQDPVAHPGELFIMCNN